MYRADIKNKVITIIAGTLTDEERTEIKDYKEFGNYTINVVPPKKRKGDGLRQADILAAIGKDKEALKMYNSIKEEKGYFGAKHWYKTEYLKKK